MLAQMQPYTPSRYLPSSFARYRQYPRTVVTPIPGAGYDVGKFVWAEQELDLDGSATPQPYGSYAQVPLRGLGSSAPGLFSGATAAERLAIYRRLPANMKSQIPAATVAKLEREAAAEADAEGEAWTPPQESPPAVRREAWTPPPAVAPPIDTERLQRAEDAARAAMSYQPLPPEESFFDKKLGPVPLWAAIGGGALVVVGGGAWWLMRKKK